MIAGGLAGTYPLHGGNGKLQDRNGALEEIVDRDEKIEGTIHRYLIVAKK